MAHKRTSTSARLMPERPIEIIQCVAGSCLAVALILGIPRLAAYAAQAMGVI